MWGGRIKLSTLMRGVFTNAPLYLAFFCLATNVLAQSRYLVFPELEQKSAESNPPQLSKPASIDEALFDSSHSFDALHYRLDLIFPMQSAYYYGSMILDLQVVDTVLSEIRLHMVDLIADSVFEGSRRVDYTQEDSTILIQLSGFDHYPDTISVQVYYHKNSSGRGYFHYDRNTFTKAEPRDARYWFPCFDEPWDKATSDIFATVPENNKVASNGFLEYSYNNPGDGTTTYHWVNNYQIATYLMNFIIGDMASWTDYFVGPDNDSLPIYNLCWREDSARAAYDLGIVPNMIAIFSDLFGPYPFDKYGQGVVEPFPSGAMEHQTMTTINRFWITGDRYYEFGIAHELAHMWWGDLVTLADWRHIWLNEGFASYSAALYNEVNYGEQAFAANMLADQNAYFEFDEQGGRFPLFNPPDLFSFPEYVKGSWVLHMLRGVVGDDHFFAGLHEYAQRYAYGNASTDEFRDVMEDISQRDLDWFFQEWIFEQGYPEYDFAWQYTAQGDSFRVHLEITQVQSNAPIFSMPLRIRISSSSDYDFTIINNQAIQFYDFMIPSAPTEIIFDPDNWVLKKLRHLDAIDHPDHDRLPESFAVLSAYPNPFNSHTNIVVELADNSPIKLAVYDIQGRIIRNLYFGNLSSGRHLLNWNGRDDNGGEVQSGTYLIALSATGNNSTAKITFIK